MWRTYGEMMDYTSTETIRAEGGYYHIKQNFGYIHPDDKPRYEWFTNERCVMVGTVRVINGAEYVAHYIASRFPFAPRVTWRLRNLKND